jgi:hypothetical protein
MRTTSGAAAGARRDDAVKAYREAQNSGKTNMQAVGAAVTRTQRVLLSDELVELFLKTRRETHENGGAWDQATRNGLRAVFVAEGFEVCE